MGSELEDKATKALHKKTNNHSAINNKQITLNQINNKQLCLRN